MTNCAKGMWIVGDAHRRENSLEIIVLREGKVIHRTERAIGTNISSHFGDGKQTDFWGASCWRCVPINTASEVNSLQESSA